MPAAKTFELMRQTGRFHLYSLDSAIIKLDKFRVSRLVGSAPMIHQAEPNDTFSEFFFSAAEIERLKSKLSKLKNFTKDKSLAVVFPEIAAQLHPSRNGDISADMIPATYHEHFIWQCPADLEHIWKASVVNRTAGRSTGCPFCMHRKVDSRSSLLALRPDLAAEWDYQSNGALRPERVVPTSEKIVSWRCINDSSHSWRAKIRQRNLGFLKCPYCSGKYVTEDNRLSILFPEIAAEFHPKKNRLLYPRFEANREFYPKNRRMAPEERPKKNRRLKASDLAFNTQEVVWWFCIKDRLHEDWQASVWSRTHGDGCPSCSHRRVAPHDSLAAKSPKLSKMFHTSRNEPATAFTVSCGSDKLFWWQCLRDPTHVFRSRVKSMVKSWNGQNTGCAICSHKKVGPKTSLAAVYPEVAKRFLHTSEGKLKATEVTANSNRLGIFQCDVSEDHVWTSKIQNVVQAFKKRGSSGCPFCYGVKVTPKDSLKGLYPIVAKHLDRRIDPSLQPSKLSPGSQKIVAFRCLVDDSHRWTSAIRTAVRRFNQGKVVCPHCEKEGISQ